MGLERFAIVLNSSPNPSGVFFPGQVVSGFVEIWSLYPKKFDGSQLKFHGYSYVRWSEGSGDDETIYRAEETYFKVEQALVQGRGSFELAAGQHQIPFSFALPAQIPSSFEGTYGHVRYRIKAFLKGTYMKSDYKREILFPVNTIVDLNMPTYFERAIMPQQKSLVKERTLGSGSIVATASIGRTGYCTGETLIFNAKIENQSSKSCEQSKIQIVQKTQYRVRSRSRSSSQIICEQTRGKIRSSQVEMWNDVPINLPLLPPSDLPFCNLMDISYEVVLTINPGTFSFNLSLPFGILIGNVPIKISNQQPIGLPVTYLETPFQLPRVQQDRLASPESAAYNSPPEKNLPTTSSGQSNPPGYEECHPQEALAAAGFDGPQYDLEDSAINPPSYEEAQSISNNAAEEKNVDKEKFV